MADSGRRPLSSGAIIAITLSSTIGGFIVLLSLYILGETARPTSDRFLTSAASPTCELSGQNVTLSYPIGDADPPYKDEVDWVRPNQLQGFTYVDVTTSPTPPDQANNSDPEHKNLALRPGTTLVITLKAMSSHATLDGIHLEWSWGETGGTQVLPVHARLSGDRCLLN